MIKELKGIHVLAMFIVGFGTIIAVNLTLAFNAVSTFPGLEVKNSYVASQSFDDDRRAQLALGWDVSARTEGSMLHLTVMAKGAPLAPEIISATFGRATHVKADQTPAFVFDGTSYAAPVDLAPGNWNLRVKLRAEDGTLFQQRIPIRVSE